jgi:alcohol dehydrogenase
MKKTRAMVLKGPRDMEMQEFELPEIGEEDGLLKLELCGVCGSDPGIYRGKESRAPRPYPIIPGHEIVGRVEKMGALAQERFGVKEGDRVVVEYAFGCGRCAPCLSGRYTLCEKFYTYGSTISCKAPPHLFGGYAYYLYIHPRANVHKIGDDLSPELGVLICAVLGNAVRWLRVVGNASIGRSVALIGPGQQGLAGVIVAKESGAEPIIVVGLSRDRERLEMARRFGADLVLDAEKEDVIAEISAATGGKMADLVMDVTGHPSGASTALAVAGIGARLVMPGLYGKTMEVPLLLDRIVINELQVFGVYSHDFRAVDAAIKLAKRKAYPLEDMISHRFPLEQAEDAIKLVGGEVESESPLKVVLDPAQ